MSTCDTGSTVEEELAVDLNALGAVGVSGDDDFAALGSTVGDRASVEGVRRVGGGVVGVVGVVGALEVGTEYRPD